MTGRPYPFVVVGAFVLSVILSSCGPTYKLRKAERLIQQAIDKGAKVSSDTLFAPIEFKAPALSFETTVENPNWSDTLFIRSATASPGDTITVKVKRTRIP